MRSRRRKTTAGQRISSVYYIPIRLITAPAASARSASASGYHSPATAVYRSVPVALAHYSRSNNGRSNSNPAAATAFVDTA